MTHASERALPWSDWMTWIGALAVLAFLALGLRGLIDPAGAARSLGIATTDDAALRLMQTTGARNVGLALLGLAVVLRGCRRTLAALLAAAGLVAAMDAWIVHDAAGWAAAAKHLAYVAGLWGFAALVALRTPAPARRPA